MTGVAFHCVPSRLIWALLLATGVLVAPGLAMAQAPSVPGFTAPRSDAQMFLEADELLYDDSASTVTAVGGVTIFYDGYTVNADEVVYDRARNRVLARGNVVLIEPSGNVLRASAADLSDTLADGFVEALQVETTAQATFTARRATRRDGAVTVFDQGSYTACPACEEDPSKPRTWMLNAEEISYDETAQMVYYRNVSLDFFGIPIAWVPFFAHADPTVARKSGFLSPSFVLDSELGASVSTPYYFALAPSYDLTITPTVYSAQGLHLEAEWRQRLANGEYSVRASGIRQFDPDVFARQPGEEDWRAGLASNGRFSLNPRWNAGWNLYLQSDRRYFRDYSLEIGDQSEVVSDIYLTGLHDRSYLDARVQRIEVTTWDPTGALDSQDQPWGAPVIDYDRRFTPPVLGGEFRMGANITGLVRQDPYVDAVTIGGAAASSYEGLDGTYGRASLDLGWRRQFIGPMGQLFTPQVGFRGDAIRYDLGSAATNAGFTGREETLFRAMPSAGLEWSWPILMSVPGSVHVVEPMAQIIVRPDAQEVGQVPVEDSQSLVFDASNLFDWDKFSGYDQVEGGIRANIGVRYTGTFDHGLSISAVIGQSFYLAGANPYATTTIVLNEADSGLESDRSDYVAMVTARLNTDLSVSASGRFDEEDLTLRRGELVGAARLGRVSASLTYAYLDAQPNRGMNDEQHQVSGTAALQLNEEWRITGSLNYDLEANHLLGLGAGIAFADECFDIALTYTQTSAAANDGISDNRLMLSVALRTLGGAQTQVLGDDEFDRALGTR